MNWKSCSELEGRAPWPQEGYILVEELGNKQVKNNCIKSFQEMPNSMKKNKQSRVMESDRMGANISWRFL